MTMSNHKPDIRKANICPPCPSTATTWEKFIYSLGIGLGSGLPKKAAGTWGTVGGLIVALAILQLGFERLLIFTLFASLIGSYICGKTSDLMNVHDDPHIVFDEWVGMWIALLPFAYYQQQLLNDFEWIFILIAFILFRFFDIIKPFPIQWVDKNVSGGFGILIDDILAGIMSAVVLFLIFLSQIHGWISYSFFY